MRFKAEKCLRRLSAAALTSAGSASCWFTWQQDPAGPPLLTKPSPDFYWGSVRPCGGDRCLGPLTVLASAASATTLRLLLAGRGLVTWAAPGCDGGGGGLWRGAVRLLRRAAGVVLAEVLVEDGLEGETLSADVAVEGLVAGVLADMVLQLIFAGVLLPTDAADEGCYAHVQAHVAVQAAFLVEGLAAVDAGEPRVVAEPAVSYLLPQVVLVAPHIKRCVLFPLTSRTNVYGYKHLDDGVVTLLYQSEGY